jgi:tripartite-type tricarboxylate transporter receptor subunit TctC
MSASTYLSRRRFLHFAAGAAVLPALSHGARAQSYPTRPVRLIVGFAPGGLGDTSARLVAQWLSEHSGHPFVVENRPGAGSNFATESVVRATADGYTLLLVTTSGTVNATLYPKLNFNLLRDIAPIAGIVRVPQIMVVNSSVPAKTVPEFIAYAKANPGKLNMASGGNGTNTHIAGELFKMMAGVDMLHVPYRSGTPAFTDLLGGRMQVYFGDMSSLIPHVRAGTVRPLAVTTAMRSQALPDVPTVGDFLPGYEASAFTGIGAPKDTPAEIIDELNKEINAALADPGMQARLLDVGSAPLAGSPAEFSKLLADETEKWSKVIKFAGLKAD